MSALLAPDVKPFARRGVCPALSAPMQTGDGLLSRIAFTDHTSPHDLAALCALALRHGNGLMDITARGGLQFRGLTDESAVALERDVLALGLPLRQGLAVETSPLAGMDETAIADTAPIVSRITKQARALQLDKTLAAKMSVIIDGGGHVDMGGLLADIRLKAVRVNDLDLWELILGGTENKALRAGFLRTENGDQVVIDLLSHLAKRGRNARGRDFNLEDVRAICGERLIPHEALAPPPLAAPAYGLMPLSNDLFAAAVAPAFSQIQAETLSGLCALASGLGIGRVRPGPGHALLFPGNEEACRRLLAHARESDFIVDARDPRSSIAVCAGKPACASAYISTRDLAAHAALECGDLLDGSFTRTAFKRQTMPLVERTAYL